MCQDNDESERRTLEESLLNQRSTASSTRRERLARVRLAAQYLESALEGTPLRLEARSATETAFALFLTRQYGMWRLCVKVLVICALVLSPWTSDRAAPAQDSGDTRNPATPGGGKIASHRNEIRWALSAICVLLLIDCFCHIYIYGRAWWSRGWHQIRIASLLVTLGNASGAFFGAHVYSGLTMAPAFLLIAEVRQLRQTIASMAKTAPTVAPVFGLFGGVVATYAEVGVLLWKDCYAHGWRHEHESGDFDDDLDVEFKGAFNDIGRASWTLFVLSTTENYPFVMYPAVGCRNRPFSVPLGAVYFTSYILIIVYLMVNTLLAAFYNGWKLEHAAVKEKDRVHTYHALLASYEVLSKRQPRLFLDDDDNDELRPSLAQSSQSEEEEKLETELLREDFSSVALLLRPWSTEADRDAAFDLIANTGADAVGRDQFLLRCRYAFETQLPRRRKSTIGANVFTCPKADSLMCWGKSKNNAPAPNLLDSAKRKEDTYYFQRFFAVLRWLQEVLCFCSTRFSRTRARLFLSSSGTTAWLYTLIASYLVCEAAREEARGDAAQDVLDLATNCVLGVFVWEHTLKAWCIDTVSSSTTRIDRSLVIGAVFCRWCIVPFAAFTNLSWLQGGDDARRIAGACVAGRCLLISPRTRGVLAALVRVWRAVSLFLVVFALAIYCYAAVAINLCAGVLPGRHHWAYDDDDVFKEEDDDNINTRHRERMLLDNRVTFNSLSEAWETLLRIAVTNNWQDVVNAHLFTKPARHNATSMRRTVIGLFLVSFYVLVVWFGTNVLAALVIEAIIALNEDKSGGVNDDDDDAAVVNGLWQSATSSIDANSVPSGAQQRAATVNPSLPPRPASLSRSATSIDSQRDLDALFARRRLEHQPSFHTLDDDVGNDGQLSARAVDALHRKLRQTRQKIAERAVLQAAARSFGSDNTGPSQQASLVDDTRRRWSRLRSFIQASNAFRSQSADATTANAAFASSAAISQAGPPVVHQQPNSNLSRSPNSSTSSSPLIGDLSSHHPDLSNMGST